MKKIAILLLSITLLLGGCSSESMYDYETISNTICVNKGYEGGAYTRECSKIAKSKCIEYEYQYYCYNYDFGDIGIIR